MLIFQKNRIAQPQCRLHPGGEPRIREPDLWLPRSDWREPRGRIWDDPAGMSASCTCGQPCGTCTIPNTTFVTFTHRTGAACPAFDGNTFTLTYTATARGNGTGSGNCTVGTNTGWQLVFTDSSSCSWTIVVRCIGNAPQICITKTGSTVMASQSGVFTSCSPLSATWAGVTVGFGVGCGTCTGTLSWDIVWSA